MKITSVTKEMEQLRDDALKEMAELVTVPFLPKLHDLHTNLQVLHVIAGTTDAAVNAAKGKLRELTKQLDEYRTM